MKKVEYWEAEDGERFETEAECIEYENRFSEFSEKVKFFDSNYKLLTKGFLTNADECYAMYISTDEAAEKLHKVLKTKALKVLLMDVIAESRCLVTIFIMGIGIVLKKKRTKLTKLK